MDRREGESDVYGEEHAPPSYYGDVQGPKMQVGSPLLVDPRYPQGQYPQVQMHPMSGQMGTPRPGDQITVVTTAPKNSEEENYGYGYCHLVCSFISILLCGIFGMIALVTAIMGYTDYRTSNYTLYKKKKKCAIVLIILSWLCAGVIIGVGVYLRSQQQRSLNSYHGYN